MDPLFPGESEMAARMRVLDWSKTALGATEHWPENLRGAVRLCLTSRFPILLWWGPQFSVLYNDAYLPFLSERKRTHALTQPGRKVWSEIWDTIGPMLEGVVASGSATGSEDFGFFFERKLRKEEGFVNFSYSPIFAADGRTVQGIFCPCFETTETVIGARRLETLRRLGLRLAEGRTPVDACREAARVLAENPRDVPFAAIYLLEGATAKLCTTVGIAGEPRLPATVRVSDPPSSPWPLAEALRRGQAADAAGLGARGVSLASRPWPEAVENAVVLPIRSAQQQLAGLIVLGASVRRPLDDAYRTFFQLVAGQVGAAVSEALAHGAERERAEVFQSIPQGFQIYDAHWRLTFMNPAAERVLEANGIDPRDAIGRHVWDELYPELRGSPMQRELDGAMKSRSPLQTEHYNARLRRWFEARLFPLPDGGLGNIFTDVTARKLAEEQAHAFEQRFATVADSAPIIIWVTDPEGRNTFVNQTFLDFMGLTREQGPTFDWIGAVHPQDREPYVEQFREAIRHRKPFAARMRARRHDGAWRWLETRGKPVLGPAGEVTAFVGCSPDITEMLASQRRLEEADRRKDEFLATLGHELRNPLAAILTGTRSLGRLAVLPGDAARTRDMIEREVGHLSRLVDDLLDVSGIAAGRIALRREVVDLHEVVARAMETARPLIAARGHRLQLDAAAEPLAVHGDSARLVQILVNLLNNAAKYTPRHGEIRVATRAAHGQAELRVADNGAGITAADLPRIFDLFRRPARLETSVEGGMGIGLSLARRLALMHGGSLEAISEGAGRGAEFVVRLPLAQRRAAPEPAEAAPRASAAPRARRILLVDDNLSFAESMSGLLRAMNHEVRTVHDGAAALRVAGEFRPEVVLLDIGLPGMRGYEVARALRADEHLRGVRIIALTGYGRQADKRSAADAGIDYHLTKPVSDEALAELLES